jgi:RecA-family ATPase
MTTPQSNTLPVQAAHELPARKAAQRWLVTNLWLDEGVGIVGGEPKLGKSFLALDLAVAVASGTPCLRDARFAVPRAGRVLLYAAEDALHIVRQRLEGICAAAGLVLDEIDLDVITVPTLRLDLSSDCERLIHTVEQLKPRLLILDPFVRLHRIDENASGEVAPLLAYLRELQRRYALSVIVVHHAKKGGGKIRAGQALRGSSEFHAWGDSNLYLRRTDQDLTLTIEHRAAPSLAPITLELTERDTALALEVRSGGAVPAAAPRPLEQRIKDALHEAGGALALADLRTRCRVRNATLHERLRAMTRSGLLLRDAEGYRLARSNGAHA